jgi:spore germination protein GerM
MEKKRIYIILAIVFALIAGGIIYSRLSSKEISVKLYYYNEAQDLALDGEISCSVKGIAPVTRTIRTSNPIKDAIQLLISSGVTSAEESRGYSSEFPHSGFKLVSSDLASDGTLTLTFSEVPGFTSGGACRTGVLAEEIKYTALQFPEVKNVVIKPDELFQP